MPSILVLTLLHRDIALAGARGPGGNADRPPGLDGGCTPLSVLTRHRGVPSKPIQPVRAVRLGVSRVCHVLCVLRVHMHVKLNRQNRLASLL